MYAYRYQRQGSKNAWAIGTIGPMGGFTVRRVVWGRFLARFEKRSGETVLKCVIQVIPPRGKTEQV